MIRFGIIGMGIRGKLYADTLVRNPYAQVVAVCDTNADALAQSQATYHVQAFTSYQDLILHGGVDALIVATPDFLHHDIVLMAADHKLHMMIEKPFSTDTAEATEMAQAISKAGVKCLVAFENRWSLPFLQAKHLCTQSSLGNILNVYASLANTLFVPTKMLPWAGRSTPAWFLFPHIIDMAGWLTGKTVQTVYATGVKQKLCASGIDTYDSIQAILTYSDGTSGVFTCGWILPESYPVTADQKMVLVGDKACLNIDLSDQMMRLATSEQYTLPRALPTPVNGQLNAPPCHMLNAFVDNLVNQTQPIADQSAGLENTKIIAAIHQSIQSGQPVEIEH